MITIITGPQGSGKTIVAEALKKSNNLDIVFDDYHYRLISKKKSDIKKSIRSILKLSKSGKNIGVILRDPEQAKHIFPKEKFMRLIETGGIFK